MLARALLVDRDGAAARRRPPATSSGANEVLMDAFYTDVRRDLADWREARGLPREPLKAYLASGHQARLETERVGGAQAAWT
jgi:L-rhamnose isomerase/sugar isomerase